MSEGELVGLMSEIVEQKWLDLHPDAYAAPKPGPLDKAHPYRPGTGPASQTCGTCQKCCAVDLPRQALLQVPSADEALDARTRYRHSEERSGLQELGACNRKT